MVFFLRILFVLLSYTFVGWISYSIYRDLRWHIFGYQENVILPITLKANLGQSTFTKQFVNREVILGRDPACHFSLEDERISLRHCKLTFHHKHWWAEDLDSTNGTFINETPITTPTIITEGDLLKLGHIDLFVKIN